jgi:ferredoxin
MRLERAGVGTARPEEFPMAYQIIASQCTVCGACEFECPNAAIRLKGDVYIINPKKCTECEGHFDTPQCASVCPVLDTCVPA